MATTRGIARALSGPAPKPPATAPLRAVGKIQEAKKSSDARASAAATLAATLKAGLDLSPREWTALFGPTANLTELQAAEEALKRLWSVVRPERLPIVIRRPVELFGGRCALDWILEGRIAEVADRYAAALSYQG